MATKAKGLREEVIGALQKALGSKVSPEEIAEIADQGLADMKALGSEGEATGQKDAAESSTEAATETQTETSTEEVTTPAETPPGGDDDEEEVTEDDLALALADALVNTDQLAAKQVTMEAEIKALKESVAQLTQIVTSDVKALKEEAEARKSLYPKHIIDAINNRRKGASVSPTTVKSDVNKQTSELTGDKAGSSKDPNEDKLGWFGEQAGIDLDGAAPQ